MRRSEHESSRVDFWKEASSSASSSGGTNSDSSSGRLEMPCSPSSGDHVFLPPRSPSGSSDVGLDTLTPSLHWGDLLVSTLVWLGQFDAGGHRHVTSVLGAVKCIGHDFNHHDIILLGITRSSPGTLRRWPAHARAPPRLKSARRRARTSSIAAGGAGDDLTGGFLDPVDRFGGCVLGPLQGVLACLAHPLVLALGLGHSHPE